MVKIAVIADTHLGTKWGTPREQDSFEQVRETIEQALKLGAELILILGDIFDMRTPRQEVWAQSMRILSIPLAKGRNEITLSRVIDKNQDDFSPVALRGTPVIALHGNHERRTRGFVNPVEALEAAGLLIHLHHNTLVFNTSSGTLAIHGMSNVPEQHAKNVLATWNPKPVGGAFNIMMLHQSVGQYVYSSEESPTIDLADLPSGFDLYLCGHIHYHTEATAHGKSLLFPGSTERTQLLQVEAEVPKGFYILDLDDSLSYEFIELKSVRDFYYEEMKFESVGILQLSEVVRAKVQELLERPRRNFEKLPLIRLRLTGTLSKEASRSEFDERSIIQEFANRALVSISKGDLTSPGLEEKVQLLRKLRERRLPIDEMAMDLLEANLREVSYDQPFDVRMLYNLLVEDRGGEALQKVFDVVEEQVKIELERKSDDNPS
ncbi:MAG: DNA repair exonuclease [Hadesarchaea archaeon]|nr:MAG: DNA repair exonuclease [Hadesarchaea archaeon]